MKVAEVRYDGLKGEHTRRSRSGERVTFPRRDRSDPWVPLESVQFAEELEQTRNYVVDWTVRGLISAKGKQVLEWGYQKKRSLASDVDLSFEGQPDEETLDGQLEEYIEAIEDNK